MASTGTAGTPSAVAHLKRVPYSSPQLQNPKPQLLYTESSGKAEG